MSTQKRKSYDAEFKVRVVLESMQNDKTIEEIRIRHGVGANLVNKWRMQFKQNAHLAFTASATKKVEREQDKPDYLKEDNW
jgi:transposase